MSKISNEITKKLTESAHKWVMQEEIPAEAVFSALASAAVNVAVAAIGPELTRDFLAELLRQFEAGNQQQNVTIN